MPVVRNFQDLKVWEKSHYLTLAVYRVSQGFPTEEMYGLISQMRRAAASIPANIAEGCAKGTDAELARYLQIAMGSASELEYHILLAKNLNYMHNQDYENLNFRVVEVKKMLAPFIKRLKSK